MACGRTATESRRHFTTTRHKYACDGIELAILLIGVVVFVTLFIDWFILLFIHLSNYRNYVWNGYDAGSKIENMSPRHVALKRWMVTDKRLKKNVVSRGSVVTSVRHLLICAKNSWVLTLYGSKCFQCHWKKVVGAAG